ncbi:serine carboxypeptidase-like 26 isoform X1 [Macadamia integrifolia]|uniref:serine carboxypeptidase-like 26 isoform X1 n=1 Tax=Macadamia integrifolia TaxID=60698 RepID=UPI001C4EDFC7|nr:serine carboxypeptidase-like 26 isoform X1 [Macadamia integrifolia]
MASAPASAASPLFLLLSVLGFLMIGIGSFFITGINASDQTNTYPLPETQQSDRITLLPGQPSNPPISHFSGYITVHPGRALFYWFFEAQSQPSKRPLLLWLNGGPGCSSIGYGAAVELGPFRVKRNGVGLEFNKYAWNKEANLLFVESPVGVGFSYTNTSSDLTRLDDSFVAEDAYHFIVNWLDRFPQFKAHDLYISGESYGGHYVPQLAELVYDRNKDQKNYPFIHLKGFIVGNPETDDFYDSKGLLEYAWSHAVISDQVYEKAKQVCDFELINWTDQCNAAMNIVFQPYTEIDIYNIYAPICLLNKTSSSSSASDHVLTSHFKVKKGKRILGGYDPCYSPYAEEYFNRMDVRLSIHANMEGNTSKKWRVCSDSILNSYNFTVFSILPIYRKLIKAGLKIWVYSGDMDGRIPFSGTQYCMEALDLPINASWHSWFHHNQVGGRVVEYEGLTFVTVRGAGHLVPLNKPSEALKLINSFLSGRNLPTTH